MLTYSSMAERFGDYWESYYGSGAAPEVPSLFAQFVMEKYAQEGNALVELGCGNGRDARFFAANGVGVTAVDQCVHEIEALESTKGDLSCKFRSGDFTSLADCDDGSDIIYSRFTLHSVGAKDQTRTLEWCQRNLVDGGILCVETRGQKNEIYRKGSPVQGEDDAFIYNDHYRRFVNFEEFTEEITDIGLTIIESAEQPGFAPFEDTDYHFIRVIAQK